jgi:hypothetical protein
MCKSYTSTLFSALIIYLIYSAIKDYGHLKCATPIEAWLIGNDFVLLSMIVLTEVFTDMANFAPALVILFILYLLMLLVFIFVWNILGTYWLIKNLVLGNNCEEPFNVAMIFLGQGLVYLLYAWGIVEGVKHYKQYRQMAQRTRLIEKDLDNLYKGDKRMSRPELTRFINKHHTILEKINILDIEKDILKQHCSREVTENNPSNECTICLCAIEEGQLESKVGCDHTFHYNCLTEWFKMKPTCPICRNPFRPAMLERYFANIDPENRA